MADKNTVLIVEDDDISIFVLKKMLSNQFEVLEARNSSEALSCLQENTDIQLVLMDINLGEEATDGTKLMQKIKEIQENTPRFIAVTSYAMAGDREYFLEQGFEDYIPKPVNKTQLLSTVENNL